MRETFERVSGFEYISFLRFDIDKRPGQHVTACIEGIVAQGMATKYVSEHRDGGTADIYAVSADGTEKHLMHGLIADISTEHTNNVEKLCLRLVSLTVKTDIHKVKRSYQKDNYTYIDIMNIMTDEGAGHYVVADDSADCINSMLLQYDETDWVFAKRLASRLNTVVIPEYLRKSPSVYIGIPPRPSHDFDSTEYSIRKDVALYMDNTANHVSFSENDALVYEVQSREVFDLCDNVAFKGQKLLVHSISTRLVDAQLIHTYELRRVGGFKVKESFNYGVIGAEIDGIVTDVKNDVVKVQLTIDDRTCADKWFPYDTVYSSPDGTGWYFMPEKGDSVRLQIPSEHEEQAHVVSAVHEAQNANRSDPNVKSISTKYGKAFIYEPSGTHWTNGTGSTISLIDGQGISMSTNNDLVIRADGNITLVCDEQVFIQGGKSVILDQGGNQVKVDENIDLTAGHVRLR